ncbi:hypothetical protein GCM10010232_68570 [Streptomyces amakusaensis]|uniref:LuxR C-terminal-related transcriptional regulator n=1 Tax=Streptomyces amakusaensis TaxID=67271 RepID=A0ABW0AUC9_9ACTN
MSYSDIPDASGIPQTGTVAHQVYEYAVQCVCIEAVTCARDLGLALSLVEGAVRDLVEVRLLLPAQGVEGEYVAVNPMSASMQLLAPYDEELRVRQYALEQVRQQMHGLMPLYRTSTPEARRDVSIERIDNLDAVRGILGRLAEECQHEVITSQPGGGRDAGILQEAARRDSVVLARGVRMRTLYQHTARFDQPTREYVDSISRQGAEVRTTGNGFMRAIIYDAKTAVISLPDNPQGATLVRNPDVTHFIVQAFEWAWVTAQPFNPQFDRSELRSISDSLNQTLMRMLASGHGDKSIARQLGMSPRTCQRRISELMQEIGARTRLQAGYLIHQHGLVMPAAEGELADEPDGEPDGGPGDERDGEAD